MKRLLQIFKTKMALHPFNSINKQSLTGHPPRSLLTTYSVDPFWML